MQHIGHQFDQMTHFALTRSRQPLRGYYCEPLQQTLRVFLYLWIFTDSSCKVVEAEAQIDDGLVLKTRLFLFTSFCLILSVQKLL